MVQSTQYYPFGSSFADASGTSTQPYKYNAKELDTRNGLNMYDYSARWKGDWSFSTIDPLAEKYYSWSPYAYVMNNPLIYTDPKGDSVRVYTETIREGHAWMSIGEGDDMAVYSFNPQTNGGNNGRSSGSVIRGKGILNKYTGTEAAKYLSQKEKEANPSSVTITDISDDQMAEVINKITTMGSELSTTKDSFSKMIDGEKIETVTGTRTKYDLDDSYGAYNAFTNNCTTFVSDVLRMSGSKVLQTTTTIAVPGVRNGVSVTGSERFILPKSLRNALNKK